MIVGSDSSELRRPPAARALDEVAHRGHQLGERFLVGVVDGRGDQATAPQRNRPADMDAGAGRKPSFSQKPLSSGTLRSASAVALRKSTAGRRRSVGGRSRFAGLEPGERPAQVDCLGQVVVRDLALGARHRGGDRLAHLRRIEARRGALC